jgi:hypothetical protein
MNRACIEPTRFIDVRSNTDSFGVRVYDDYGQAYDNTWDVIPDDDFEVIRRVIQSNDEAMGAILSSVIENEKGIFVGDIYYPFEEIQHLFA